MINKTYLFEKLLSYCDNLQGVDEQVLNAHLQKHGLTLRADHRSFLLKYGNSKELLKFGFGDWVILPFLMDRISRIKYSSMVAYRRWLDEAVHGCRTRANEWHSLQHRSNF